MHHHIKTWDFDRQPIGNGYAGPDTYEESRQSITTADGQVAIGAWRYDGTLQSSLSMSAHQTWVVIRGRARITIAGDTMELVPGSVVCFEAPYGPKVVEASDGFEAVWIGVPQKQTAPARDSE